MGGGPPKVRLGATVSNPWPSAPQRKNSASKYSKFKGNSIRSTSDLESVLCLKGEAVQKRSSRDVKRLKGKLAVIVILRTSLSLISSHMFRGYIVPL